MLIAGSKTARTPVTFGIGKMTPSWRCWFWKLGLASWLAMGGVIATLGDCALAQIAPDNTLGRENSTVTSTGSVDQIDSGATRGANLFHSFEQFSVPTDPSQGLVTLPAQLVEASGLIAAGCAVGKENEFVVTGRAKARTSNW